MYSKSEIQNIVHNGQTSLHLFPLLDTWYLNVHSNHDHAQLSRWIVKLALAIFIPNSYAPEIPRLHHGNTLLPLCQIKSNLFVFISHEVNTCTIG